MSSLHVKQTIPRSPASGTRSSPAVPAGGAHESLLTVMKGSGRVKVGELALEVSAGDTVFVPRWAMHQTLNTGDQPMELLAVTDYGLTKCAFLGDQLSTTRMCTARDADSAS